MSLTQTTAVALLRICCSRASLFSSSRCTRARSAMSWRSRRLRFGDVERHGVERAAQPAELVAALEAAAGGEIARGELLGRVHQPRGAPGQQEMEHQPHRQRERRHPSRPVERLLQHLRARFRLVALEIVGEEQAAGPRRTQLVALAAHQDAGVAEQHVAVRVDRHAGAALADRAGGLVEIELRQHVRDLPSQPGAPRRGDDRRCGRRSARRG